MHTPASSPAAPDTPSPAEVGATPPLTPPPLVAAPRSRVLIWSGIGILCAMLALQQMHSQQQETRLLSQISALEASLAEARTDTEGALAALRSEQARMRATATDQTALAEQIAASTERLAALETQHEAQKKKISALARRVKSLAQAPVVASDTPIPAPQGPRSLDALREILASLPPAPAPVEEALPSSTVRSLNDRLKGLFHLRKKPTAPAPDPYAQLRTLNADLSTTEEAYRAAILALPPEAQAPFASWLKTSTQPTVAQGE